MFRHVFPKLSAKQQLVQGWNNPRFNSLLLGNVHQRAGFHQYQVKHAGSCFQGISSSVLPSRRFLASTPPTVSPMSENQERAEMRLKRAREEQKRAESELGRSRQKLEVRKHERDAAFQAWQSAKDEEEKEMLKQIYQSSQTALNGAEQAVINAEAAVKTAQSVVDRQEVAVAYAEQAVRDATQKCTFSSCMLLRSGS